VTPIDHPFLATAWGFSVFSRHKSFETVAFQRTGASETRRWHSNGFKNTLQDSVVILKMSPSQVRVQVPVSELRALKGCSAINTAQLRVFSMQKPPGLSSKEFSAWAELRSL
jgi:hypothetical protein